jgi:hypothetical protein
VGFVCAGFLAADFDHWMQALVEAHPDAVSEAVVEILLILQLLLRNS